MVYELLQERSENDLPNTYNNVGPFLKILNMLIHKLVKL